MISEIESTAIEREEQGKEFLDSINDFEKNMQKTFVDICEGVINQKLEKYDGVCKSFSQFFCEDDLKDRLAQKADIRDIEKMKKVKASKTDL